MTYEQAASAIAERFGSATVETGTPLVVSVPVDQWRAFAQFAKESLGCRFFNFLSAVDWKDAGLEVVAVVDNLDDNVSLRLKTRLAASPASASASASADKEAGRYEAPRCASLVPVFRGANWMERECYDMFGIVFEDHPDLRRILLGDDWQGHPLLKSYAVDTPHPPYR
jgi:NADH-quinone oxidoreductase subunit C